MLRVLMIDDESRICSAFRRGVRAHGILLDAHCDLPAFLRAVRAGDHAALLIDWNLRTCEGNELCAQLRREGEQRPIAIVSGKLQGDHARDLAKASGADAFISKPISGPDLARKIHELARLPKREPVPSGQYRVETSTNVAGFELQPHGFVVLHQHRVRLAGMELALFSYLLAQRGRDVSHEELIEHVLDLPFARTPEAKQNQRHLLQVHISRLREKFGDVEIVRTVKGGYRIDVCDSVCV